MINTYNHNWRSQKGLSKVPKCFQQWWSPSQAWSTLMFWSQRRHSNQRCCSTPVWGLWTYLGCLQIHLNQLVGYWTIGASEVQLQPQQVPLVLPGSPGIHWLTMPMCSRHSSSFEVSMQEFPRRKSVRHLERKVKDIFPSTLSKRDDTYMFSDFSTFWIHTSKCLVQGHPDT